MVLPWAGMVDLAAEKQRLETEISTNQKEIARLEQRLRDTAFTSKAPAAVVEKKRSKLQACEDKLLRLRQELSQLS